MKETRVRILDCFPIQSTYGKMVLARVESKAQNMRFGDDTGPRWGRYIVYWTDTLSAKPVRYPGWWFRTLKDARSHFEAERAYEQSRIENLRKGKV